MWITETGLGIWHSAKPSWSGDGSSHRVPKMDGWLLTTENDPNLLFPPDPPGWISYFKIILFAPTSPRSGQTSYTSRTDVTALISLAVFANVWTSKSNHLRVAGTNWPTHCHQTMPSTSVSFTFLPVHGLISTSRSFRPKPVERGHVTPLRFRLNKPGPTPCGG
jgi:hypothetical protein